MHLQPGHRDYAEAAAEHSADAVRLRRPEDHRSLVFDTISIAVAGTLCPYFATAGQYAVQAIALAEDGMRLARVTDRLAALWQLAAPHADQHPELAEFGARLAQLRAA